MQLGYTRVVLISENVWVTATGYFRPSIYVQGLVILKTGYPVGVSFEFQPVFFVSLTRLMNIFVPLNFSRLYFAPLKLSFILLKSSSQIFIPLKTNRVNFRPLKSGRINFRPLRSRCPVGKISDYVRFETAIYQLFETKNPLNFIPLAFYKENCRKNFMPLICESP